MSTQIHRPGRLAFLLLVGALSAPGLAPRALAQDSTVVLRGIVLDSASAQPIPGVLVKMDTGPEAMTSNQGRFELRGIAPGPHLVAVLSADCRVNWMDVDVTSDPESEVRFIISRGPTSAEERLASDERRRSQGKLVTRAEIQEMRLRSLAEVIRRVEPTMVGRSASLGAATPIRGRSRNSFSDEAMEPVVVVDGVRASDGSRLIHSIDPSDVALLEVLPGSAGGWEYGSDGAAGVIRVTTVRGLGARVATGEATPESCVVPDFPIG
ncbi:MAG: TonB-dependent receptor plug domain-containing protein [Longimicrobiales bacterium]|nr:TonB-dependent receptor plug domain-containing protein [Longimicrobiales bacterium]